MKKDKIAIVVQRFGNEINGGSEYSAKLVAERLSKYFEVEVLTTKAQDYLTWENHYQSKVEYMNDILIRRFEVVSARNIQEFNRYSEFIFSNESRNYYEELEWMKKQGPISFELLNYIKMNKEKYKVFIFFTYNYFTTYFGLQLVPEKSILIPTAHDEPPIYLSIYKPLFHLPRYIIFLTEEEKEFVHNFFENNYIPHDVTGIGIDIPVNIMNEYDFRKKFKINDPYILYMGRIDESKGCSILFDYFIRYKKENNSSLKLVLVGKSVMKIPNHSDIVSLGFIDEKEKYGALSAAECLVMPSKYESLSMVVLESLYMQTPVLVNEESKVLKGHCERGNAGLYYSNYEEFQEELHFLFRNGKIAKLLGSNGKDYVEKYFNWNIIVEQIRNVINKF